MRMLALFIVTFLPWAALAQSTEQKSSMTREPQIETEIKSVFAEFVQAQNARDEAKISKLLRGGPEFLWITTSAGTVWGHDQAMQRFLSNWKNQWKLEPVMQQVRVVEIGPDAALLNTPLLLTSTPQGQEAKPFLIKWSGVFTHTPDGWKIAAILLATVPAH